MTTKSRRVVVAHLDESCLGNGRQGPNPGGAGGLVEARAGGVVARRELYLHSPETTNNRMALAGAIALLQLLSAKGHRLRVIIVSDSEYLVRGVREWLPGWKARGWKRKDGEIENLALWQALAQSLTKHEVDLGWVRGHAGHVKNEFANVLAIKAAREQITSNGIVDSSFDTWLAAERKKGRYQDFDPDADFARLERLGLSGKVPFALDESAGQAQATA